MSAVLRSLLDDLRVTAGRLGAPGFAGLALLALAAILQVVMVLPRERELESLQVQADSLQAKLAAGQSLARRPPEGSAEQLATFYAFFPKPESAPQWLGKIHAAARANGIVLRTGEYRLERRADQKLARYQVTLPVVGSYAQVRAFIAGVLAEVPAAAIDEIQMRRDNVASTTLEVRIRLSLYLRNA